jgi:hypothetical protein
MRPFVWVRYHATGAWMHGDRSVAPCGPRLENATAAPAFDIHISDLTIDPDHHYQFARIDTLEAGGTRPLEAIAQPGRLSLTKAISRHVVASVLAGRQPATHWPIRVAYRSQRGRSYETCCEIRVLGFPLGISSIIVPCPDDSTPSTGPAERS